MNLDEELARLRDQMEQTKALYEGAKAAHRIALEHMRELGQSHPDGSIRHAEHVLNYTLQIYMDALFGYNRFLLDHHGPEQNSIQPWAATR